MSTRFVAASVIVASLIAVAGCECNPARKCALDEDCGTDGVCQEGRCAALPASDGGDADAGTDAGNPDAGGDAGADGGSDSGTDAGADAGPDAGADGGNDAGEDAGLDAGSDAGTDAGEDAGVDAGNDAGEDAGADAGTDAGTDAGADGGLDAGYDAGCVVECEAYEQCVAQSCLARYAALTWTAPTPTDGTRAGVGAVDIAAQLTVAAGRQRADPSTVEFTAWRDGGTLLSTTLALADAGLYLGSFDAASEGLWELRAEYAGLSTGPTSLTVDRTGPAFTLVVSVPSRAGSVGGLNDTDPAPGYAQAWRRDEVALVTVMSTSSDVAPSSVLVQAFGLGDGGSTGTPGGPTAVQLDAGCGQPYCGIAQMDLSLPELKAFRGMMELRVSGEDDLGNRGGGDGGVLVTRFKWSYDVGAAAVKTSPAIGGNGVVYFGTVLGSTGALHALNVDGTPRWSFDAGAVEASPAIGRSDAGVETVFVAATNPTEAALFALTDTGALLHVCAQPAGTGAKASLATANLLFAGETVVSAVGLVNSGGGRLTAIRPGASSATDRCIGNASAGAADFPSTVSIDGTSAYFSDEVGKVQGFSFNNGWLPKWTANIGLFGRGLAAIGSSVIGGGGGPSQGGVFRIDSGTGAVGWSYPTGSSPPAWSPSIGQGDFIYFGDQGPTLTRVPLNGTSAITAAPSSTVKGAPAIGRDGTAYTGDIGGELAAWTPSLEKSWSVSGLGILESSPALDCSRNAFGAKLPGRPGVLYVGSSNTGKFYSIVVDSRGIDTLAPWPKYQRDPRNTGNASTPLADFACP